MGSTLIMGRKTFESIGKKPLPGRINFVMSRTLRNSIAEVRVFSAIEEAVSHVATEKAFIMGGSELFQETINLVDGIYLTRVDGTYEGDRFYPEIPQSFEVKSRKILQQANPKVEVIFYESVNQGAISQRE